MKYLSVCSGIEAATCAWHSLGWTPVGFSEIEKFPSRVLAHHYPHVRNFGDLTRFKEWPDDLAPDIIVGGTPCQSFSVAGLRKGLADPRGNLALVYLALADRYRPEWLVWENVPGVLSSGGGRDFGAFLGGLVELGYGFAYRILDAQFFGVAQRRRRVFVVANARDWRRAAAVLFEPHSLSGHPAPRRETGERPAPTISSRPTGGGGLGTDFDLDGGLIARTLLGKSNSSHAEDQETYVPLQIASTGEISHCLNAGGMGRQDYETETLIAHALKGEGFDASEDGTGRGTSLVPVSVALCGRDGGATAELGDDLAFTLRASSGGGDKPHVLAFHENQRGEITVNDTAGALNKGGGKPGQGYPAVAFVHQAGGAQTTLGYDPAADTAPTLAKCQTPAVHTAMAVRRLTPRECERLQGFEDDYTLLPGKAADGPRYKALGNSMAVPCMAWIGQRIAAVAAQSDMEAAA